MGWFFQGDVGMLPFLCLLKVDSFSEEKSRRSMSPAQMNHAITTESKG